MSDKIGSGRPYLSAAALQRNAQRQGKNIADQIVAAERDARQEAGMPVELGGGDRISLHQLRNIVAHGGYLKGQADEDGVVTLYASAEVRSGLGMSDIGRFLRSLLGMTQSSEKQQIAKDSLRAALANDYGPDIADQVVHRVDALRAESSKDYFTHELLIEAEKMAQDLLVSTPYRAGEDFAEQDGLEAALDSLWTDDLDIHLGPKEQVLAGEGDRQAAREAIARAFAASPQDVAEMDDQQKLALAVDALNDHLLGQTSAARGTSAVDNLKAGKALIKSQGLDAIAAAVAPVDGVAGQAETMPDFTQPENRKRAERAILLAFTGDKRDIGSLTQQQKFDLAADALEAHIDRQV